MGNLSKGQGIPSLSFEGGRVVVGNCLISLIPGPIPTFRFAWFTADYVRFGSKADIGACRRDVRFTPKSGHWNSVLKCPLCAKSRSAREMKPHLQSRGSTNAR